MYRTQTSPKLSNICLTLPYFFFSLSFLFCFVFNTLRSHSTLLSSLPALSVKMCHNFLLGFLVHPHNSHVAAKSLQLCLALCDPTDVSPPGSPVSGILQARLPKCHSPSTLSFSNFQLIAILVPKKHRMPWKCLFIYFLRIVSWEFLGCLGVRGPPAGAGDMG